VAATCEDQSVLMTRRVSVFLLAVGVWTWLIWPNFLRNIWKDDRAFDDGATSFFVFHLVLVVTSLVIGTAVGLIGWRGYRATRRASGAMHAQRRFVASRD
jgi:hypothetical protein